MTELKQGSTVVYKRWHKGTLNPDKQKNEGRHDDLSRSGACFSFADCTNMHCRQPYRSWGLEGGWARQQLLSHGWWREAYLHQAGIEPRLTVCSKVLLEIAGTDSSTVPLGVSGTIIIFAHHSIGLAVSLSQLTVRLVKFWSYRSRRSLRPTCSVLTGGKTPQNLFWCLGYFTDFSKKCACCTGHGPKRAQRAERLSGCKRADCSLTIQWILGTVRRSLCGQVGNAWNCTSIAPYVFIEWCTYHTTYYHSPEDRKLTL